METPGGGGYRTSSFCNAGGCVAVAFEDTGSVLVRDTKRPQGEPQVFTPREWSDFIAGVKNGEFDVPG